jgi:hypothetical protein
MNRATRWTPVDNTQKMAGGPRAGGECAMSVLAKSAGLAGPSMWRPSARSEKADSGGGAAPLSAGCRQNGQWSRFGPEPESRLSPSSFTKLLPCEVQTSTRWLPNAHALAREAVDANALTKKTHSTSAIAQGRWETERYAVWRWVSGRMVLTQDVNSRCQPGKLNACVHRDRQEQRHRGQQHRGRRGPP